MTIADGDVLGKGFMRSTLNCESGAFPIYYLLVNCACQLTDCGSADNCYCLSSSIII